MELTVKITHNNLPRITQMLGPQLSAVVENTAQNVLSAAKRYDRSKRLNKTFTVRRPNARTRIVSVGSRQAFFGQFIEFGTNKQPARPFMGPAAESERPNFEADVKAVLRGLR